MYRERCRPKYSDTELVSIYSAPWAMEPDWVDHVARQVKTLELAGRFIGPEDSTGADLSCGDAYLASHITSIKWFLGDFAPGYDFQGPIEETIRQIPYVDVFVCTETLEHLDDPDAVLRAIRYKAKKLIISTPLMRWWDENPQHYWSWDQKAVKKMLRDSGWEPVDYDELPHQKRDGRDIGYSFQCWSCV